MELIEVNRSWFLQIVDREFEHGVQWKVLSQIVDRDSVNLYPMYPPFPYSDF